MRKCWWLAAGCGVLGVALVGGRAVSQPAERELPFAGPAPPQELQVLAHRVGEWTSTWEAKPSLQDPQGYTARGQARGQWLHNGHFVRMEGTSVGETFRQESSVMYGYDRRKKVYRRWLFTSSGLASECEGMWDAARQTMTWKQLHLNPGVTGTITEVLAEDRLETQVLVQGPDGQVLTDVTIRSTRKK